MTPCPVTLDDEVEDRHRPEPPPTLRENETKKKKTKKSKREKFKLTMKTFVRSNQTVIKDNNKTVNHVNERAERDDDDENDETAEGDDKQHRETGKVTPLLSESMLMMRKKKQRKSCCNKSQSCNECHPLSSHQSPLPSPPSSASSPSPSATTASDDRDAVDLIRCRMLAFFHNDNDSKKDFDKRDIDHFIVSTDAHILRYMDRFRRDDLNRNLFVKEIERVIVIMSDTFEWRNGNSLFLP